MEEKKQIKQLIRIFNTDVDGSKSLKQSLRRIKGINFMFAHAICKQLSMNPNKVVGDLSSEEIQKIEAIIKNPSNFPVWMLNRRKDYETGEDKHLFTVDLDFIKEGDIKRLKKIKAYKGIRHMFNLPVRGQRTKGNFRKMKGKINLGVKRTKKTGKV